MPNKVAYLISTIKQLELLKTATQQRTQLLKRMRVLLADSNMIMSDTHLLNIINYLVSISNSGWLFSRLMSLKDIDCLDLHAANTKLIFSLAFVRNPKTEEFELCILTNKKYYNADTAQIAKHNKDNTNRRLGSGGYKVVNSCLMIVACNNKIEVSLRARATVIIGELRNLEHFRIQYAQLYENLNKSTTINDVLVSLNPVKDDFNTSIRMEFLRSYQEITITNDCGDLDSVDRLTIGIPFLKQTADKKVYLKLHIFDKIIESKHLYPIHAAYNKKNSNIKQEMVRQFIIALTELHAKGIIHRDLKPDNLLLDLKTGIRLKIIDWGFAVNVKKPLMLTRELVKLLGLSRDHCGYIDGKLLNSINLEYVYNKLLPFAGWFEHIVPQTEITLDSLNTEIKKYLPDIDPLIYLDFIGSIEYVAPEIFEMVRHEYYQNDPLPKITLASEINKIKHSDIIANNKLQVNEKHDIWAAGVSIVEYCLGRRPLLTDSMTIAFIERNLLLQSMLHSNPELRCDTNKLLELSALNGPLVIPNKSEVKRLSSQYINKIKAAPLLFAAATPHPSTTHVEVSAITNKKQKSVLSSLLGN